MTIDRPMFPPRAESEGSSSLQPVIGQPRSGYRVSEFRRPADGLSRRLVLAGVASAAALPVTGCWPQSQPCRQWRRSIQYSA